jgi:hypothetical protein
MGMSCCKKNSEQKRTVTLKFKRENLDYSIKNYAYIEGHVMSEDAEHNRHMVIDIEEDGNRDRVSRILSVVHGGVIEMLYPLTKVEAVEEEVVDDIWEPEEYVVELSVPTTMSRTTIHLLSKLIHEYMVYRVLHDWLTITNGDAAAHWADKAAEASAEINRIKNERTGILTRPLQPW